MGRSRFDDHEIVKCAILYSKGEMRTAIGERLGIRTAKVSKNIEEAMKRGIIRIEVNQPREIEVAERVRDVYKLKDVYAFSTIIAEQSTTMLARLLAAYLERSFESKARGEVTRIAIGPGRAPLALVNALSDETRPNLRACSTASPELRETYMASNTLIGIMAGKWKSGMYRFDPQMSPEEQRKHGDIFIFGIERVPDMKGVTALFLQFLTEAYMSNVEKELMRLAADRGVGIINYQPIDEYGVPLDWNMEGYNEVIKPKLLTLEMIREIAAGGKKEVICIASGIDNAKAIKAALRGGYFNVLITDYDTATLL